MGFVWIEIQRFLWTKSDQIPSKSRSDIGKCTAGLYEFCELVFDVFDVE